MKTGLVLAAALLVSAQAAWAQPSCYEVIPLPQKITLTVQAAPFELSPDTKILYTADSEGNMERNAGFLAEHILKYTGMSLGTEPFAGGSGSGNILLVCDGSSKIPAEGYEAVINSEGITVSA